ncbi:MAG: phosphoribosyl 1,2-cyclic phosphodiesterase [Ponticaulis sp.]|nr:phosphoribosyl 1,2-cyclic phosphodiesterase [Ponticaulis sp.]
MPLKITILGCGSSGGVPRIGNDWGVCDPENPKNTRTRCGIHILAHPDNTAASHSILIDTPPELRQQLIRNNIKHVDTVLFTHDHADQTHGIDDVRVLAYSNRSQLPVYSNKETLDVLSKRFSYCFVQPKGSSYPPILKIMPAIKVYVPFDIGEEGASIEVLPLDQDHGRIRSLGFRIGDFAYCNDVVDLPERSLELLEGVKLLIVDTLRYTPHPTHAHLDKSLGWIERLTPEQAVLTNLHIDLDYDTLSAETPENVAVAYDGMTLVTS